MVLAEASQTSPYFGFEGGSLPRHNQHRTQQAATGTRHHEGPNCAVSLARTGSARIPNQPCLDSISVNQRAQHRDSRNKFNTLTPAEAAAHARRLRTGCDGRQAPSRTASVLHKPRAPPMLVGDQQLTMTLDRRRPKQPDSNRYSLKLASDTIDCAPHRHLGQSMSLDLAREHSNSIQSSPVFLHANRPKLRDITESRDSLTNSALKQRNSTSRLSLSSSTSKVFQNFKRLFQRPSSAADQPASTRYGNNKTIYNQPQSRARSPSDTFSYASSRSKPSECFNQSNNTLGESISQICLNRSQSPQPVCEPPPSDFKSMSYMENNSTSPVNYSNYDEFTKLRNEQTNNLLSSSNIHKTNSDLQRQHTLDSTYNAIPNYYNLHHIDDDTSESWQLTSLPVSYERNLTTVFEERRDIDKSQSQQPPKQDHQTSKPPTSSFNKRHPLSIQPPTNFSDQTSQYKTPVNNCSNVNSSRRDDSPSSACSPSQSMSSIATVDSVLDSDQQVKSATRRASFRFSYTQPLTFDNNVRSLLNYLRSINNVFPLTWSHLSLLN